jgi:large subunit ribosomal protein L35
MGKLKTRKAAAKRFKVTATGKVLYGHQMARHKRRKNKGSNMRRKEIPGQLTGKFAKKIKQMIGA